MYKIELDNEICCLFSTGTVNCKYTSGYISGIFQNVDYSFTWEFSCVIFAAFLSAFNSDICKEN